MQIKHLKISRSNIIRSFTILLLFSSLNKLVEAKIRNFETTRMKSTAGAGVASFLVDEASILNPAPIAFSAKSSFYYQKGSSEAQGENKSTGPNSIPTDNMAIIASDGNGNLKGSISYVKQTKGDEVRTRISSAVSSLTGKQSSMGFGYRYTKTESPRGSDSYKQLTAGVYHYVSPNLSVGLVVFDPLKERPEDVKVFAGFQYSVGDFLTFMFDGGADYTQNLSNTTVIKAATSLKIFSDFYARAGYFEDKGLKQKGTGAGIGWEQPKLVLEFAIKNTEITQSSELDQEGEQIKESSFSLSYRF